MEYLRNLYGKKTLDMAHVHAKGPSWKKRIGNIIRRSLGYGGAGVGTAVKGYKNLADAEKTGESFWKKFFNPLDWGPSEAEKKSDISLDQATNPDDDTTTIKTELPNLYDE